MPTRRRKALPKNWPSSKVERRMLDELQPYARNARGHSKANVAKIARSIEAFGWTMAVLIDEGGEVIAGHGRLLAAEELGIDVVPVIVARDWSEEQKVAYRLADNRLTLDSEWDQELLAGELEALNVADFDLGLTGFDEHEIQPLLFPEAEQEQVAVEPPDLQEVVVARPGDLWLLGEHRLLCGDSTRADDWARLSGDDVADAIVADPPYGMGKEKDGVANDNQYGAELDAFQLSWIRLALEHLAVNGSLYVWGNAPDLWRLWYTGGLSITSELTVRNEIAWDKGAAIGMRSAGQHGYPVASERCLFLMRGQQFKGNQNRADYWDGWDPLREHLAKERKRAKLANADVNRIVGKAEGSGLHWFTRSQFAPMPRDAYDALREHCDGKAFAEGYDELFARLYPEFGDTPERFEISARMREGRSYFDNEHESMTDVWRCSRVRGEERFGHATPKPVEIMSRQIRSSVPAEGLVLDPFSGTGTVTIAAEILGVTCYALELEPRFVDVAIRRWQEQTGESATLEGDGRTFAAIAAAKPR